MGANHRHELSWKCAVVVDEAGFNINMRSSIKGTPAETPSTRPILHTISGAITTHNVISIEIREPRK